MANSDGGMSVDGLLHRDRRVPMVRMVLTSSGVGWPIQVSSYRGVVVLWGSRPDRQLLRVIDGLPDHHRQQLAAIRWDDSQLDLVWAWGPPPVGLRKNDSVPWGDRYIGIRSSIHPKGGEELTAGPPVQKAPFKRGDLVYHVVSGPGVVDSIHTGDILADDWYSVVFDGRPGERQQPFSREELEPLEDNRG